MAVLTLTLDAAMQYWSASVSLREKKTSTRPTKCAVIGLVANALGYSYDDDISALAALRFAVTINRSGAVERDYKTVGTSPLPALPGDVIAGAKLVKNPTRAGEHWISGAPRKNVDHSKTVRGSAGVPESVEAPPKILMEEYLADASFTIALEGDVTLLREIHAAVQQPARAIYFGRRAYSPGAPLVDEDSLREDMTLDDLIAGWSTDTWCEVRDNRAGAYLVRDQPMAYGINQKRGMRREIAISHDHDDFFDF